MMKMYKNILVAVFVLLLAQLAYSQTIRMNEIYSRGTTADPDWIEIYNGSAAPVKIGSYKIYDSGGQEGTKAKKTLPVGLSIPAYGYYVIVTDEDGTTPGSKFGLSSSGEKVWLEDSLGAVIDTITFAAMGTTESYGRTANVGSWKLLPTITKGKSNITLTELILPQYIQGLNGTNNSRIPYIFRVKIDNLLASTTYRFINQITTYADGATTNGAGNCIYLNADKSFTRTSSAGLSTAGQYGEFTTDVSGSYTGWFISEPTGNARFTPGNNVFMKIRINDGSNGTVAVNWLTTGDSVKVINFGTANDHKQGTAIYGRSLADPKDFVFLYDNVDGTGRPLAGSVIEKDGLDLAVVTSTAQFYRDSVDNFNGAWGTIIPNQLANGVRRIERRVITDGSIFPVVATDDDGVWPSGVNTVNPLGGTVPVRIESSDARIPVELTSFAALVSGKFVTLNWSTSTEINNSGFDIERKSISSNWQKIAFVSGNGTTTESNNYSFSDKNLTEEKYSYRLKQVDFDGSFEYSKIVEVSLVNPTVFSLEQNYPNPFNPATTIKFSLPVAGNVKLAVYNLLGQEVQTLINGFIETGSHSVNFEAVNLNSGIYFYRIEGNGINAVRKMTILK